MAVTMVITNLDSTVVAVAYAKFDTNRERAIQTSAAASLSQCCRTDTEFGVTYLQNSVDTDCEFLKVKLCRHQSNSKADTMIDIRRLEVSKLFDRVREIFLCAACPDLARNAS